MSAQNSAIALLTGIEVDVPSIGVFEWNYSNSRQKDTRFSFMY